MSSRSPDLSPGDVRLLVSLVPRDCVPALVELRRHGLLQDGKARLWITARARQTLLRLERVSALDTVWALEDAAQEWLRGNTLTLPVESSEETRSTGSG